MKKNQGHKSNKALSKIPQVKFRDSAGYGKYFCTECLKLYKRRRICCGYDTIGISKKARIPKQNGRKSEWQEFINRFVWYRVANNIEDIERIINLKERFDVDFTDEVSEIKRIKDRENKKYIIDPFFLYPEDTVDLKDPLYGSLTSKLKIERTVVEKLFKSSILKYIAEIETKQNAAKKFNKKYFILRMPLINDYHITVVREDFTNIYKGYYRSTGGGILIEIEDNSTKKTLDIERLTPFDYDNCYRFIPFETKEEAMLVLLKVMDLFEYYFIDILDYVSTWDKKKKYYFGKVLSKIPHKLI